MSVLALQKMDLVEPMTPSAMFSCSSNLIGSCNKKPN
jgi:hypothetical protein